MRGKLCNLRVRLGGDKIGRGGPVTGPAAKTVIEM